MPDTEQKDKTVQPFAAKDKQPTTHAASDSAYPPDKNHTAVFGLLGTNIQDDEISRAWTRLFDRGMDFGPALGDKAIDQGVEYQYFAYGKAVRDMSPENVNKTVVFANEHGYVGEESGL